MNEREGRPEKAAFFVRSNFAAHGPHHRTLPPFRGFHRPEKRRGIGGCKPRPVVAPGCDGRRVRAEHQLRLPRHQSRAALDEEDPGRSFDDREAGPIYNGFRRSNTLSIAFSNTICGYILV